MLRPSIFIHNNFFFSLYLLTHSLFISLLFLSFFSTTNIFLYYSLQILSQNGLGKKSWLFPSKLIHFSSKSSLGYEEPSQTVHTILKSYPNFFGNFFDLKKDRKFSKNYFFDLKKGNQFLFFFVVL